MTMAARTLYRDHTNESNARKQAMALSQQKTAAITADTSREYTDKQLENQNEYLKKMQFYNGLNLGLDITKQVINFASDMYGLVEQSQMSEGSGAMASSFEEGSRILTKSIYDGTTYFGTDPETGEATLVLSPELEEWRNNARLSIENGNYMKSVKDSLLQSFDLNYESLKTQAFGNAIKQSYADLNSSFASSMDIAKRADIASYVQAGGDLDLWSSSPIQGVNTITARNDWSDNAKQAQITQYMLDVQAEGDRQIASSIALNDGLEASYDWIRSRSYMTEDEKQSAYRTASNAVTQRTSAIKGEVEYYMEDAIVNGTATPKQVIEQVVQKYGSEGKEIVSFVSDTLKDKQTELVSIAASQTYSEDRRQGLSALQETYDMLTSGQLDDTFYNLDSLKEQYISQYDSAIYSAKKQIADEINANVTQIESANSKLLSDYEKSQDLVMKKFDAGIIDGKTAVSMFQQNAIALSDSLSEGGKTSTSLWSEKANVTACSFIDKLLDNYVPSKYKTQVEAGFSGLKAALGLNKTNATMTEEEQYQLAELQSIYYGRVADYIYQNGATASADEMLDFCRTTASNIAVGYGSKSWTKVQEGNPFATDTTAAATIDTFNDLEQSLTAEGGSSGAFVRVNKVAGTDADGDGEPDSDVPLWIINSAGAMQTFNELAEFEMNQLNYLLGKSDTQMVPIIGTENGEPVLVPDIIVDGVTYRIRDENILYNEGSGWEDTGYDIAESEGEMYVQKIREKQEENPPRTYEEQLRQHAERKEAKYNSTFERWTPPILRGGNLKPANMEKF
ncbi:MAG: hypothetical protein ACI3ZF_01630 [Candidatus Cryptobacteroides sp.]